MNLARIVEALTAAGLIGAGARWVWPRWRRLGHFLDDWFGEPPRPGVDRRPGAMERLRNVEAELHPNHGGSLRDRVEVAAKEATQARELIAAHVADPHAHQRSTS